jgi:hypothetical protein
MSAVDPLATMIATAIRAACATDEERVRQIVREEIRAELAKTGAVQAAGWMTPPAAARSEGRSVKQIRSLIRAGKVETRVRNLDPASKHPKREVRIESLRAALCGAAPEQPEKPVDAQAFARHMLARRAAS